MLAARLGKRATFASAPRLLCITTQVTYSSTSSPSGEGPSKTKEATKEKKTTKKAAKASEAPTFDNTSYKVAEYYGHNPMTFFDLDVEMAASRLPQPSSLKKVTT